MSCRIHVTCVHIVLLLAEQARGIMPGLGALSIDVEYVGSARGQRSLCC